jgi:hypothetical protein
MSSVYQGAQRRVNMSARLQQDFTLDPKLGLPRT